MDPALRGVDEDEGSPLQNGVNRFAGFDTGSPYSTSKPGKSRDQRKPSG